MSDNPKPTDRGIWWGLVKPEIDAYVRQIDEVISAFERGDDPPSLDEADNDFGKGYGNLIGEYHHSAVELAFRLGFRRGLEYRDAKADESQ
jgi:hypothetical protein